MIQFVSDLIQLTPVQHLVKYWWVWLLYAGCCFGVLKFINNKK
ncbi:hypothetical protein [Bacillus toyonensis]|nr:hypothetical protein [Bacillus toyonensis]